MLCASCNLVGVACSGTNLNLLARWRTGRRPNKEPPGWRGCWQVSKPICWGRLPPRSKSSSRASSSHTIQAPSSPSPSPSSRAMAERTAAASSMPSRGFSPRPAPVLQVRLIAPNNQAFFQKEIFYLAFDAKDCEVTQLCEL